MIAMLEMTDQEFLAIFDRPTNLINLIETADCMEYVARLALVCQHQAGRHQCIS